MSWREDGPLDVMQVLLTNRGYTGHETITEVGLIHMNGTIDASDQLSPTVHRFEITTEEETSTNETTWHTETYKDVHVSFPLPGY